MASMLTELERKLHHQQPRERVYLRDLFYNWRSAMVYARPFLEAGQRVRIHRIPDPDGPGYMWAITPVEVVEPCS